MKKSLMCLLILIFSLQIANAETKIFSGKVITGTDKEIEDNIFRFTYDENSQKAFVQTPAGGLIVDNGACKPNNIFRVCINSANFSHKNITTYEYYYEVDTTIYKLTGSLTTSSKAKLNSLLQGELTELTVTITNPTEFEITSIALAYGLEPFYVVEAKGCELNDRQMSWKGSLQSKYDKTCTAAIIAEKEGKYSLAGNLSYFNGFETEKKATDTIAITVLPKQLKVSQFVDKDIGVKKPFYFNISLQNIHSSEDINAVSTITLPSHVSLIKDKPAFDKNARVLKHSSALKPNASLYYSLYMEKLSEGTEPINLRFAYSIKGINDIIENSTFVDIISAPAALPQPKTEEKKLNETTINLTATSEVQPAQTISGNKTAEANFSGNKTAEQVTIVTNLQESKPFSKNILLLIIAIFVAFIIVTFAVFRIRKRKKGSDELAERVKEKLKEPIDEQIK
ncbi:hypothetical protein HYX04_04660 [Candidatus Woesearchaeota archaeon]|nr:hypothetical protein [Candidatus Woesearchaeota archaeon]